MNIDKTRKVVSIVLMCLMIGSIVFNAFNIVGHCASDSDIVINSLPFPIGAGFGNTFTQDQIDSIVSQAQADCVSQGDSGYPSVTYICIYEVNSNGSFYVNCYYDDPTLSTNGGFACTGGTSFEDLALQFAFHNSNGYLGTRRLYFDSNFQKQSGSWVRPGIINVQTNTWVVSSPTGGYMLPTNTTLYGYPIYSVRDLSYDDVVYFSNDLPALDFGGHSKGGNITDYTFDQTDEAAPTDPSAVAGSGGWLSKILGVLNKLNKTVGDGFTNLVDNLQSFFNPIFGAFEQQIDNFKTAIESKLDDIIVALGGDLDTTDTSLSDTFITSFQGSKIYGVVTTFNQGKGLVSDLFNAVPSPQTLRFEFDLPTMNLSGGHSQGGSSSPTAVKPYGNKLVMDFGWYENVRSIVVPFIIAWLYVGMLVWLLRAIPGFISGSPSFNTRSISDGKPIVSDRKGDK